ncbi:MAG: hypothetical protein JW759_04180, partial [Candidatus Coatesbacteria bacterium]|nr:hypothetical protein [Candidatus Coatesbacteria bacterium]
MRFAIVISALFLAFATLQPVAALQFTHYMNSFGGVSYGIAAAQDGSVWFRSGAYLTHFSPDSEQLELFSLPSAEHGLIALDAAGAVWVCCGNSMVTVREGQMHATLFPGGSLCAISAAPDGSVWTSINIHEGSSFRNALLRFEGDAYEEVEGPTSELAYTICFESDGTGWFTYSDLAPISVARYKGGSWDTFSNIPSWNLPYDATVGEPGELWVS